MANVEDDLVPFGVEHAEQGDAKLDRAERTAQVSPVFQCDVHNKGTYLGTKTIYLARSKKHKLFIVLYGFEHRSSFRFIHQ
jgi:hypothetical protein